MSSVIIQEDHYSVQITKDLSELAFPLKRYGIDHFGHARSFIDGSVSILVDNKTLYQHHLKSGYRVAPDFPFKYEELKKDKYHCHFSNVDSEGSYYHAMYDFKNLFGLHNFIYFINRNENYVDFFVFASPLRDKKVINFYLNQREVLEQFIFDYKNKASRIITRGEQNKLYLPQDMQLRLGDLDETIDLNEHQDKPSITKRQHYIANFQGKYIKFTKREFECLQLLQSGYTAKETAIHFELSPRTIENHINNIKSKFGFNRKPDIIKAFLKCTF